MVLQERINTMNEYGQRVQPRGRVRVERGLQEHTYPPNYRDPDSGMDNLQRWVSGLSGAALLYYGLRQQHISRWFLTTLGAGLVYQGVSGNSLLDYLPLEHIPVVNETPVVRRMSSPEPTELRIRKSLTVNRPASELYDYWRDLSKLPTFMTHVKSVQEVGDDLSHWVVNVMRGMELEWDARITVDRPNEMIAWETLPESTIQNRGYVKFIPTAYGTEVSVSLEYDPPAIMGGEIAGRAVKFIAEQQIKEEIRNFKRLMETGELPTTEGQPSGRDSSKRTANQHAMMEQERLQ
jgi:uncharacterized membrane protein